MSCDYHVCAQCRQPLVENDASLLLKLPSKICSVFRDGRHKVNLHLLALDVGLLTPARSREIARQLLDAADECEDLDWKNGIT